MLKGNKTAKVIEEDKMAKVKTLQKQTSSILDPAISDYINAPPLTDWENAMEHFLETKRLADIILEKSMSREFFITQVILHKLPAHFISELETKLQEPKENYTVTELLECMNECFNSTVHENLETGTKY